MPANPSPLQSLRNELASTSTTLPTIAVRFAANANSNASHNTYLGSYSTEALHRAEQLPRIFPDQPTRPALYGIPISIKDCFDVAGTITTCGSSFYAQHNPPAPKNSWVAQRLLDYGAILTGKTHLHQLAYGVTGENPDFGDCLQPRDATLLTGGSSSGAAASVQEGSALAAVGTDTGGSIRIPSALCGLAGYRTSHGIAHSEERWAGGYHLAQSFDTIGLVFRDLRDAPALATAIFDITPAPSQTKIRIGCIADDFLHDSEPNVLAAFDAWKQHLTQHGAELALADTHFWTEAPAIYSPIVASEAAAIHRGHFQHFDPVIAERLAYGASIPATEIQNLRARLQKFRFQMSALFESCDFLIAPCAPVSKLRAGHDHTDSRKAILRYTTPASLSGLPAITLPGEHLGAPQGTGVQLLAAPMQDAPLLAFAANL
ncbi:MAG TPA: amidase [Edaphobacter sp.]|jgi:Asp-tRNA(Asn)/Glu-tRNA(Gln) amidotransferase A subunit family amidase|nr:amidase [Edaphobacter sp.]